MAIAIPPPALVVADRWRDYRLVDCGDGMKQERWGEFTLVRPDPQIVWPRTGTARSRTGSSAPERWTGWDGFYHRSDTGGGKWEFHRPLPESWQIRYDPLDITFKIRPTSFKHTGLFPEQAANWDWFSALIRNAGQSGTDLSSPETDACGTAAAPISVLNLFGYTGAATVAAAKAGASVCHVDAAEGMVKWCRENAALSGLAAAPVRYIVDDCLKFARRELRRNRRYDAIIMDPPTYGRGAGGEMWRLEDSLWDLLVACRALLSERPLFFLINAYTARLSPLVVANLMAELLHDRGGTVAAGEIALPIERDGKVLPCGIYGRWQR